MCQDHAVSPAPLLALHPPPLHSHPSRPSHRSLHPSRRSQACPHSRPSLHPNRRSLRWHHSHLSHTNRPPLLLSLPDLIDRCTRLCRAQCSHQAPCLHLCRTALVPSMPSPPCHPSRTKPHRPSFALMSLRYPKGIHARHLPLSQQELRLRLHQLQQTKVCR
jgi:hypothetical protein